MADVKVFYFLASYVVAFAFEWLRLTRRSSVFRFAVFVSGLAGLAAHTVYLFDRSSQTHLPPLLSSTHDWMLVLAWLAIVVYLFVSVFERDLALGLFLLPFVLILIGSAYFVSDSTSPLVAGDDDLFDRARRGRVMLHAELLVFGIAGVIIGFVLSLMYLVQHRRLKHRQALLSGLALPSLERLARWNSWSVMISVPMLTLGMLTGFWLRLDSNKSMASLSLNDPVILGNGLILAVMLAFFVWLVSTRRPRGKQVAWLTIWAFGFLLVTLIGLQVLSGKELLDSWHV